jgi:hypothetical protein
VWSRSLRAILALGITLAASPALAVPHPGCYAAALERLEAAIDGHPVPYYKLDPSLPRSRGILKLAPLFGGEDSVFLGINEGGHYYVMAGDLKYDGKILELPETHRLPGGPVAAPGAIIHFTNLPQQVVAELKREMSAAPTSITVSCVSGACRLLRKAGIRIAGPGPEPLFMASTLERVARNGFEPIEGRPVEYKIYVNSDRDLNGVLAALRQIDEVHKSVRDQNLSNGMTEEALREAGPIDDDTRAQLSAIVLEGSAPAVVIADGP